MSPVGKCELPLGCVHTELHWPVNYDKARIYWVHTGGFFAAQDSNKPEQKLLGPESQQLVYCQSLPHLQWKIRWAGENLKELAGG